MEGKIDMKKKDKDNFIERLKRWWEDENNFYEKFDDFAYDHRIIASMILAIPALVLIMIVALVLSTFPSLVFPIFVFIGMTIIIRLTILG